MAQRVSFSRARRFLWYRPASAVTAIGLAPWSGLLAVMLLAFTALLLDLAIHRGLGQSISATHTWAQTYLQADQLGAFQAQAPQGLGLASVAIRSQDRWFGPFLGGVAARFPGLWNNYYYLMALIGGFLATALIFSLVTYLQKKFAATAAIDASTRLRRAVHTHAYRLSSMTLRSVSNGQLVSAPMRALDTLQEGLAAWFSRNWFSPLNLLWLLAFLFALDALHGFPWMSLLLLAGVALYWLVSSWILTAARRAERAAQIHRAQGLSQLSENFNLMRLVKTYGMEQYSKQRLERLLHRQARAVQAGWRWQFLSRHGRWTLAAVLATVLGFAMVGNLLDGSVKLVPLITMLLTMACLAIALRQWQSAWQKVRKARLAAFSLFQLLDRAADVKQVVGAEFLPPLSQSIELDRISVSVPGTDSPLLQDFSLGIGVGEQIAIVGDDRARLTIAYLIPRLIDPEAGEVRFDGRPLPEVSLESLRRQVGLVLQEDLIFNDTVAQNISCGDEKYSLPQIIDAAKAAHAHHFIMKLGQGYDTLIGDLGESTSVSERFRIALARAILRDPTVVVIEEPAMGLTAEEASWLDDTLLRFLRGRTVILLPHRLSWVRRADRVVLLHHSRVVDSGTDAELMQRCEPYRRWQYVQFHALAEEAKS